jgi:hypothetical protein
LSYLKKEGVSGSIGGHESFCSRIKKGARSALIDTVFKQRNRLLDFGFLELNMLAHDGVIFAERHLFGDAF